jgi:hypothetical protein
MKNDTTFKIELEKVNALIEKTEYSQAEDLVSKMLRQYNGVDFDLFIKRARIRQCQMRYEDALLDANLAHNLLPQCEDAY